MLFSKHITYLSKNKDSTLASKKRERRPLNYGILSTKCQFSTIKNSPIGLDDIGAGMGSRTPILSLGRIHNSRYTIPAGSLYYTISL